MSKYSDAAALIPDDDTEQTPKKSKYAEAADIADQVINARPVETKKAAPEKPQQFGSSMAEIGALETGAKIVSGTLASVPASLYQLATGDKDRASKFQQAATYEPRSEAGKQISAAIESKYDPLTWPSRAVQAVGEATGSPRLEAAGNLALLAAPVVGAKMMPKVEAPVAELPIPSELKARLEAHPDLKQTAIDMHAKGEAMPPPEVIRKHLDAADVGTRLTEGQASGDVAKISEERNDPKYQGVFNSQEKALVKHFEDVRTSATPDVQKSTNKVHGQAVVDELKSVDDAKQADISAKYQAIKDANGGKNPIDPFMTVNSIYDALKEDGSYHDLSPASRAKIEEFKADPETMDINGYLRLRKSLSRESGTANDGTIRHAAGVAARALDDIKLKNGVTNETLQAAEIARKTAKERFDLIERNPVYKSVVKDKGLRESGEESPLAENFIEGHVVNKPGAYVREINDMLSPETRQHLTNGTLNFIEKNAIGGNDNFNHVSFAKALGKLDDKKGYLLPEETAASLEKLRSVAKDVKQSPPGHTISTSRTAPAIAVYAKKGAEALASAKTGGLSKMAQSMLESRAEKKAFERSTAPLAYRKISDIGK